METILESITPLILTYNEAANIDRTLQQLRWAKEIIIVDSYSTDATLEIIANYPQAKMIQHRFESFASQCNFGLSKISSEWVLSLDADYILSQELIDEIRSLSDNLEIDGYLVPFKYAVFGKALRGTLYPPRKVLYRRNKVVYENDGHAHRAIVDGNVRSLSQYIYHDDRKPLSRWLWAQDRYMMIESQKLLATPEHELSWSDRLRKRKIFAPFVILIYCLIIKGGILDGWQGWYYAFQRTLAELLLSIHIIEVEYLRTNIETIEFTHVD
jgi:glycosyltransferase involved in cell wall biosynthesis